jgi:lysophospholipase L1-like esterase
MRGETFYKTLIVVVTAGVCVLLWWMQAVAEPDIGILTRREPSLADGARLPLPEASGAAGSVDAPAAIDDGQITPSARRLAPWEIPGTTLDEAAVNELLPNVARSDWLRYDPVAIALPIPDKSKTIAWAEHPDGEIVIATNNMGFREDAPTQIAGRGRRVLVFGDSHTFGLANNRECFANVLETRLGALGDGHDYEVINAGVSATGPFEYEGAVRKYLALQPDAVVVVFYAGNDFSNAMAFSDFYSKRRWPPLAPAVRDRIEDARKLTREILAQSLSQVYDFTWRPSNGYTGLAASIEALGSIAAMCRQREVPLLIALLPTKEDADVPIDADRMLELVKLLGLNEHELGVNRRLTRLLDEALTRAGVRVLDLYEPMRAVTDRPLYWRRDHHLNVDGHALVGELLEAPVRELLAGS